MVKVKSLEDRDLYSITIENIVREKLSPKFIEKRGVFVSERKGLILRNKKEYYLNFFLEGLPHVLISKGISFEENVKRRVLKENELWRGNSFFEAHTVRACEGSKWPEIVFRDKEIQAAVGELFSLGVEAIHSFGQGMSLELEKDAVLDSKKASQFYKVLPFVQRLYQIYTKREALFNVNLQEISCEGVQ